MTPSHSGLGTLPVSAAPTSFQHIAAVVVEVLDLHRQTATPRTGQLDRLRQKILLMTIRQRHRELQAWSVDMALPTALRLAARDAIGSLQLQHPLG